jgi:hypothetical protein
MFRAVPSMQKLPPDLGNSIVENSASPTSVAFRLQLGLRERSD